MSTRYAENAGAKMKRSIHDYFSAQTAYHDANRGRGKGKIGNNTYIVTNVDGGGGYSIVLHRTPIVTYHPDGRVTLRSGGYQTVTTKARMNEVLPMDIRVYQERHDWFVSTPQGTLPFVDGMVVETGATTSHSGGPHEVNPPRHRTRHTPEDDREIRRVYAGSTYWIRKAGRNGWMVTADGQPITNPAPYGRAVRALLEVTGVDGARPWVETWEERDNVVVRLYIGERGDPNRSVEIASWRDDDVRQMVEDGFFKPGRLFETSVIEYAADMKMLG